ncbi:MAG: hypothetical protein HKN01_05630 [Acidimicrobiia bacterium]|nr:hypothetical protein [Acidimicrobiia bacterium]NNF69232.1 hypothetical protein [Acidimicrobiia bacterium]
MSDTPRPADPTGVVYDRGYAPYTGVRHGSRAVFWAIVKDGVRRGFGIRRKFRYKILPWSLATLMVLPAAFFVGFAFFFSSQIDQGALDFFGHQSYAVFTTSIAVLFVAFVTPELIVPDREEGVLAVYASRPVTALGYLSARAAGLALTVGVFLFVPQVLLYLGLGAVDPDGFAAALTGNLDQVARFTAASATSMLALAGPALLVSLFAARVATGSGIYLGTVFGLSIAGSILFEGTGQRWGAILSPIDNANHLIAWVFGGRETSLPERADIAGIVTLLVVAVVGVVAVVYAHRRYREEL